MKILDRYIIKEFLAPFFLSLAALLLLLLTQQMLRMAELLIEKGVQLSTLLKIFVYLLPSFLIITLPIAVLIASISAFNRFSTDAEIIAFKSAGISLYRLLRPIVLLSLGVCVLVYTLSVTMKPWSGFSFKDLALKLLKKQVSIGIQEGTFNNFSRDMVIYVERMPTFKDLEGILIYDQRNPDQPHLIVAKEGSILSDPGTGILLLHLASGSIYMKGKTLEQHPRIYFSSYDIKFDLRSLWVGSAGFSGDQPTLQEIKRQLKETGGEDPRWLRSLQQYYRNYALPLASLIFGIVGVPLGVHSKRAGRLGGFAIGIAVVGLYYILMVFGDFLVTTRLLSPLIAAWFPNLVSGVCTVFLTLHAAREGHWKSFSIKSPQSP